MKKEELKTKHREMYREADKNCSVQRARTDTFSTGEKKKRNIYPAVKYWQFAALPLWTLATRTMRLVLNKTSSAAHSALS